jgi:hypothetical protein
MKTQFGIFLIYPLVIGIAILSMSSTLSSKKVSGDNNSLNNATSIVRYDFYGPYYGQDEYGWIDYLHYTPKSVNSFSLAFVKPKGFISFKEALAFKESRGSYRRINTLGYMGKYQFGAVTLNHFGVRDGDLFLNSPKLQEKVFLKYLNYNYQYLADYIDKYEGKTIGGVKVTESGILAAAHLSGPGGVRRFLDSNGSRANTDAYGASVKGYMKKFGGYDVKAVIK